MKNYTCFLQVGAGIFVTAVTVTFAWLASTAGIGFPKEIDLFFFILQLFIVESDMLHHLVVLSKVVRA